MAKRLADTTEAAQYAGLGKSTFDRSRITGFIGDTEAPPHIRIGARILYDLDEIDAWLDRNRRRTTSETRKSLAAARA
jgi:predicted DNA-binding transcriptional regulator AlpA